jgi:hypothetical protein
VIRIVSDLSAGSEPSISPAAFRETPRRISALPEWSSATVSASTAERGLSLVSMARCKSDGLSGSVDSNSASKVSDMENAGISRPSSSDCDGATARSGWPWAAPVAGGSSSPA